MKILVSIQFSGGTTLSYDDEHQIEIKGKLYPRQLKAAGMMLDIYKQCAREDNIRENESRAPNKIG